ncbi:MAG: PspA-associated protein PspAB [Chloroflexota bacterium]
MVREFFDALLGRSKPVKPRLDKLFAISTAYVTLTVEMGMRPSKRAGVCFRPLASAAFDRLRPDLERLLELSAKQTGSQAQLTSDSFNFHWVVLEDEDFEDLVATIHVFSQTLQDEGFGEQLLAAVFMFQAQERPFYWIYNYKRGLFYPFAPLPGEQRRDNPYELRLQAAMERELPVEPALERWYPLWGIPL